MNARGNLGRERKKNDELFLSPDKNKTMDFI
jgi:hypothetical protein